jgi:diguanylate cyclase (GGDEF)-like protein
VSTGGRGPEVDIPAEEEWVVLLEADGTDGQVDLATLEALLFEVAEASPISLYSPDRYALQIAVEARTPPAALHRALRMWRDALRRLGAPLSKLVRAEVLTPEELRLETQTREARSACTDALEEALTGSVPETIGEELLRRALSDALTGLPGMEVFRDHVRRALAGPPTAGGQGVAAVVLLDLDGFSALNRAFGHGLGDRLLSEIATRLLQTVRATDIVARAGGDEFAAFVSAPSSEAVARLAERMLDAVRSPLPSDSGLPQVTASLGVAVGWPGASEQVLVEQAAVALAAAKHAGGNRVEIPGRRSVALSSAPAQGGPAVDLSGCLALLQRTTLAVSGSSSLEEAGPSVLQQLCAHGAWEMARLSPADGENDRLLPTSIWHFSTNPEPYHEFRWTWEATSGDRSRWLSRRMAAEGGAVWISDTAENGPFASWVRAIEPRIRSALAFPVLLETEVVAMVELFGLEPKAPDERLASVVHTVGLQLGWVIARNRAEVTSS